MKKFLLLLCVLVASSAVYAQLETPAPSPFQKMEQKVGLTDITLEYSRPSMKGRNIFGGLVPFDKVWRTGANENTKVTFDTDVEIGGKTVKAGTYAIYTKPMAQNWEIMFYTDTNNWGLPQEWDESKVAAKVTAPVYPLPTDIETFTMSFDDVTNDGVNLGMMWERTYVAAPIKVPTDKMVTANIERVMGGPSANDYYQAAVYYLQAGKDMEKAKTWINKAIDMREQPAFWFYRQKSLIYAESGDKKGAVTAAKKSLELAKEAGNSDYVALNTKSLKEWGAM
ncbi:MAG: dihydrolipoamide dehydrogenase [Flavobacteriaceae bacterium]|nr:dihydrolipoamide dehydrogenase [Flavobacteriaceae bacterium]|tara:strand:+ start:36987 stop:37832 length:846 start_codon:yes stop_codon:yes gene_type:complete